MTLSGVEVDYSAVHLLNSYGGATSSTQCGQKPHIDQKAVCCHGDV